jgi:hypothetical protein
MNTENSKEHQETAATAGRLEHVVMWLNGEIGLNIYQCGWGQPRFSIGRLMPMVPDCWRCFWHGGWHIELKLYKAT